MLRPALFSISSPRSTPVLVARLICDIRFSVCPDPCIFAAINASSFIPAWVLVPIVSPVGSISLLISANSFGGNIRATEVITSDIVVFLLNFIP